MPVEIRELVIRATVSNKKTREADDADSDAPTALTDADRTGIVRTAVEEVLRILKTSKER